MKRVAAFFLLFLLIFLLVIGYKYLPKHYKINYTVNGIDVIEEYNYGDKYYSFNFSFNGNSFDYLIKKDYISSKRLIKNLHYTDDNCLVINSTLIKEYKLCKEDNKYYSSFYNNNLFDKSLDSYDNVKIYNLSNHKYYLWNYTYFIYLSESKKDKLQLFDNDVYNIDIAFKYNNDLYIANYDDKYTYDLFYIINTDKNKIRKLRLNVDLYFDGYILGTYKKNAYVYDNQKEVEYRIDLSTGEVNKNNYGYYSGNKWIKSTKNKVSKNNIKFIEDNNFYFSVEDNNLIYNTDKYHIYMSNIKVDYLIDSNSSEAFFINKDTLYYVNVYSGINKVMTFKEWNYNLGNIFVF